jgi:hypothetical protein
MYAHNPQPLDGSWWSEGLEFVGKAVKSQFQQGSAAAPIVETQEPSFLSKYGMILAAGAVALLLVVPKK